MHPQLTAIAGELSAASDRAHALVRTLDEAAFQARPAPDRWSAAECLAHLKLTSRAFLPIIDRILAQGTATNTDPSRRYRRDFKVWLLCRAVEPLVRHRLKTPPPFVPTSTDSRDQVLSDFARLQDEFIRRLEAASGQRRHLWQAEQGVASIRAATFRPQ